MNDHILYKIRDLNEAIKSLKQEYLEYITDKEYTVDIRWCVYSEAPIEMKEHKSYIQHFTSLPDDFVGYDMEVHAEKYETILMVDLVVAANDWNNSGNLGTAINIDALKEEILQKNIGSFIFNW